MAAAQPVHCLEARADMKWNDIARIVPELKMGLASLFVHKLRSLLTMLGMIFGVGAVVAMLSITAGAQKEMESYIDSLGVNNIILEAREALDRNELQLRRQVSPGLSFRDYRAIRENVQTLETTSARKRFKPMKLLPKPTGETPLLVGVEPSYQLIHALKLVDGRFFDQQDDSSSAQVCVLGEGAKISLFGYEPAVGRYVKVNDIWLQVVGVLAQQATAGNDIEGLEISNGNNLIIAPLNTAMRRFEDNNSYLKDEIDGIYMRVKQGSDSIETASIVNAILAPTHKDSGDFSITVPAGLLEQRRRNGLIFSIVMLCIAGISLLVGGIGIMNIMLATVLERTREIGIRRAIGARQADIVRQFLTEAVLISIMGGLIGIIFGVSLSKIIASAAGWSTVVSTASIAVAFGVSVGIGLVFGIYPAVQAARLDPIEAIRYE
jgi:putative ABC transport system permease protein